MGKKAIVGIPNFCHIRALFQVFFKGRVPMTRELPYEWYDTPNLRFLSLKDFRIFCEKQSIRIEKKVGLSNHDKIVSFLPNLFAHTGIYLLSKDS